MAFVKIVKNNAYYKRYQTQYRRRREGRTDYYARKRMITQDKNKYNTPKYRLVARITCSQVITQIVYQTLKGDRIISQAKSSELKKYGLTAGLANYSAAYSTGLLQARRLLNQLGMDKIYKGNDKVDGKLYNAEDLGESRRPFTCVLDIGLAATTTGAKVFGVMKGAVDGGLQIPHSEGRFPGFKKAEADEEECYEVEVHRERILGVHVDKYMKELKSEPEDYKKQFSKWDECLKKSGSASVEALMTKIQAEIRKNPVYKKIVGKKVDHADRKFRRNPHKLTRDQRKKNVMKKMKAMFKKSKK